MCDWSSTLGVASARLLYCPRCVLYRPFNRYLLYSFNTVFHNTFLSTCMMSRQRLLLPIKYKAHELLWLLPFVGRHSTYVDFNIFLLKYLAWKLQEIYECRQELFNVSSHLAKAINSCDVYLKCHIHWWGLQNQAWAKNQQKWRILPQNSRLLCIY